MVDINVSKAFGRYELVRQIATGGMAEIYLAKHGSISGFEKFLVLKVIHPQFSHDKEFIGMLIDEAKIAVQLSHVNIGQIYDLGVIDGNYYIAMEYIDGKDLYQILCECTEKNIPHIPFDTAAFIAHEVCCGLDYAHTKRDEQGNFLKVIHRDISPQNILISKAGEVKIVDFGIAKASIRVKQTQIGVIKGKFFYMSPEQAWGQPLDGRTDVFSTGICLYEMITGEMLYNEDKPLLLLDMVRKADIRPPSKLFPDLPKELETIVMKALQKHPEHRFQSAREFQMALSHFVYQYSPNFSRNNLAEFTQYIFHKEKGIQIDLGTVSERTDSILRSDKDYAHDESSLLFKISKNGKVKRVVSESHEQEILVLQKPLNKQTLPAPRDPNEITAMLNRDGYQTAEDMIKQLDSDSTRIDAVNNYVEELDNSDLQPVNSFEEGGDTLMMPVFSYPANMAQAQTAKTNYETDRNGLETESSAKSTVPMTPRVILNQRIAEPPTPVIIETEEELAQKPFKKKDYKPVIVIGAALFLIVSAVFSLVYYKKVLVQTKADLATIKIESIPEGATIILDNEKLLSPTPYTLENLPLNKKYSIILKKKGYQDFKKEVLPKSREVLEISAPLERLTGSIKVQTIPVKAEIKINGEYVGLSPKTVPNIPIGKYFLIELNKKGYYNESQQALIGESGYQELQITLKKRR